MLSLVGHPSQLKMLVNCSDVYWQHFCLRFYDRQFAENKLLGISYFAHALCILTQDAKLQS
ncbi:MAG: hypothetical protein ACI38O_08540 [Fibrobacter intestinalis]|uniref:hypothetical protein n=1 Tax=Fibrobacter intestinalis TaxID=28122 RepID=UPI003F0615CD